MIQNCFHSEGNKREGIIMNTTLNNSLFYTVKQYDSDTLHQITLDKLTKVNQSKLITTSNTGIHDSFV